MAPNFDVFCVGKSTIDQFLAINEFSSKFHLNSATGFLTFKHGEKIEVDNFDFCLGGNATNVAVGLSRLGLVSALCSETGNDEFGEKIRKWLEQEKIDRSYMVQTNSASSFSVILNYKNERTIFTRRIQRENHFHFDDVVAKYIFLTSLDEDWKETYKNTLSLVIKKGFKLALNPGTLQINHGKDIILPMLKHTDILFVNKEEAEELVFGHEKRKLKNDHKYIQFLLTRLLKMGVKTSVITNGRFGSNAMDEHGNFYHEGVFPANVVERTGAGDSYTAGFLAAIILGRPVKEAMKWGGINSASVVGKIGAIAGLLYLRDLEKRVEEASSIQVKEKKNLQNFLRTALGKIKSRR